MAVEGVVVSPIATNVGENEENEEPIILHVNSQSAVSASNNGISSGLHQSAASKGSDSNSQKPVISISDEESIEEDLKKKESSICVKRMTRKELEDFCTRQIVYAINSESDLANLRKKIITAEVSKDKIRDRMLSMGKELQHVKKEVERLHNEVKSSAIKQKWITPPAKLYRTVGIQIGNDSYAFPPPPRKRSRPGPASMTQPQPRPPVPPMCPIKPETNVGVGTRSAVPNLIPRNPTNQTSTQKVQIQAAQKNGMVKPGRNMLPLTKPTVSVSEIEKLVQQNRIPGAVQLNGVRPVAQNRPVAPPHDPRNPNATRVFSTPAVRPPPPGQQFQGYRQVTIPHASNIRNTAPNVRNVVPNSLGPLTRPVVPAQAQPFKLPPTPLALGGPVVPNEIIPPKPELTLSHKHGEGIVLTWTHRLASNIAKVANYQIFMCQEPLDYANKTIGTSWRSVGNVQSLPLPMACTLSQFAPENSYYFIVRAVDIHGRSGPFCVPQKSKMLP